MRTYLIKEVVPDKPFPPYVNWEITNRCNMGCPYCFLAENPGGKIADLSKNTIKKAIEKLEANGAQLLNFAGGEPLLRHDIIELIKFAGGLGLKTILSTNGIKLEARTIKALSGHLDWISLPLDGPVESTHAKIRGRKGHFKKIIRLIGMLQDSGIRVKINTMVCKDNLGRLEEIAELLSRLEVDRWKLFQFSARGKAKLMRQIYEVYDEDFEACRLKLSSYPVHAILSSNELRDNAYFLIRTDGKVHVPIGGEYVFLGDLLSDPAEKFRNPALLDFKRNIKNVRASYDYPWEERKMAGRVNILDVRPFKDPCGLMRELYHSENISLAHVDIIKEAKKHKHLKMEEIYFVLSGHGSINVDGEIIQLIQGDLFPVPVGAWHFLRPVRKNKFEILVICHPRFDPGDFITEE